MMLNASQTIPVLFNTARDVSCYTASGSTADPAESDARFPIFGQTMSGLPSTIYSYFLPNQQKEREGTVSYATMKNLDASKDDNPVALIYILLSTILVFSFLGTFLDPSGKRSPKAAASE